jgi:glycerol-3-phosphate O-acyltransferase
VLVKAVLAVVRVVTGRYRRFGTAAAAFGAPLSLRAYLAEVPDGAAEGLAARMMQAIEQVVPVVPVCLVAAALCDAPADRAALLSSMNSIATALAARGADLKLAERGLEATLDEGLSMLIARRIVSSDLRPLAAQESLLRFYAASVQQRLGS